MMAKTKDIFSPIINEILETANNDAIEMTKDPVIENAAEIQSIEENIKARERSYTALTDDFEKNYKKTHEQKIKLKCCFFWIVMPLFILIVLGSLFSLIISLFITGTQIEVVLGSVISLITAIIAIPTIIAKYLFPINEDNDMSTMINKMQNYDKGIRRIEKDSKNTSINNTTQPSNDTE